MSGMDMMFKAMGLDPEAMQKSAAEFKGAVVVMSNDLKEIKRQNALILERLDNLTVNVEDTGPYVTCCAPGAVEFHPEQVDENIAEACTDSRLAAGAGAAEFEQAQANG